MNVPVFLRGETVTLRPIDESHLDFLLEVVNDPAVWSSLMTVEPTTRTQEREWIENAGDDGGVHLVIYADGDPVGTVGFDEPNDTWGTAELGYFVDPAAQGNGYATDAVRRLVRYGFEDRRLHKVYANVYETNAASMAVLENVGFEREGVHREHAYIRGERVDVHRFGLLAAEFE